MSDTGRASIAASNLPARKSGTVDISSHGSSLPTSRSLMLRAEFLASLEAHSSVASCLRYAGHRPLCRCAKLEESHGNGPSFQRRARRHLVTRPIHAWHLTRWGRPAATPLRTNAREPQPRAWV